jgi:hypothetical protein
MEKNEKKRKLQEVYVAVEGDYHELLNQYDLMLHF